MTSVIRTIHLNKTFNKQEAVINVNMNVKKGEIYGILGENGAGKTTIMKMLMNLLKPTSGEIQLFGDKLTYDSYEVLKRIGSIIEYPVFYEKLTGRENLEIYCEYMGYYEKGAIDRVLELVNLRGVDDKKVLEYSLGMKQRLGLARTIITKPELLILDEPINGLDPVGIKEFRTLFKKLSKEYGMTILISSHILSEIEHIADTIGVMNKGCLIKEVPMANIKQDAMEYIQLETKDTKYTAHVLSNKLDICNFRIIDEESIKIFDLAVSKKELFKMLVLHEVDVENITHKHTSLEEYFLELIKGDEGNA